MENNIDLSGSASDIHATTSTIDCTSPCGLNEFAASCSLAAASAGTVCPVNCGECTTCPEGTASSILGVTSLTASPPSQCACNIPYFLSFEGSKSCDYCDLGYYDSGGECSPCPDGATCTTKPEKDVVINTATTLGFEGGADAFDTDAKAKFASAIEETLAAGDNGIKATVKVTAVTDASRRLGERAVNSASVAYDGAVEVFSKLKTLGLTIKTLDLTKYMTKYIKQNIEIDLDGLNTLAGPADQDADHTRRSLAVTQLKVSYTITISVKDNAAIGDAVFVKVCMCRYTNVIILNYINSFCALTLTLAPTLTLTLTLTPGRRALQLRRRRRGHLWCGFVRRRALARGQAGRKHDVHQLVRLGRRRLLAGRDRTASVGPPLRVL